MAIAGIRGTGDWGTDERPKSFREMILWRNPNGNAPLTALMAKMKKKSLTDPEHSWWEEDLDITRVATGAEALAAATTITLAAGGTSLIPGDMMLVEKATQGAVYDNELITVATVVSDTSITVKRGVAGTTAATIPNGAFLLRIGSSFAEGSGAPNSSTQNPVKLYNYAQIWKTTYSITNTADKTEARTGDAKSNDKKRKMFRHSTELELSALFGVRSETTGDNGKPQRTMGGLMQFLRLYNPSNGYKVYTSTPDAGTFFDDIYGVFDYDTGGGAGDERIVLCGNQALNRINKIAAASGQVQFTETVKLYGMNLTRWVTPQGSFYFKTHPLLNRHPVYTKSMFIIDPTGITWKPLRDTNFQDNIQLPGDDLQKGQWLTEGTIEFTHLQTMKYLGNLG